MNTLYTQRSSAGISWSSPGFSFHEKKYIDLCTEAIAKIETLFSVKIRKDFSLMQHLAPIEDIMQVVGESFSRAKPHINDFPDINNKGLQMLCSPGYWSTSQNHLLCFILSEIQRLNGGNEKKKISIHEVGPGCGYLLNVLSGIKNVSLSGSDCYDSNSFDIAHIATSKLDFSETINGKPLEIFCYYLINNLSGLINCIVNSPVSINSLPAELTEADIVYSHLPVIDQYDGDWNVEDWKTFFNNVFNKTGSRVQSLVFAANDHSKSLQSFCSQISQKGWQNLDAKIVRGNICNGLIIVLRKRN